MRNDLVLTAIKNYLSTPTTDYAVLLNGPWGCGKTYFWRTQVAPAIAALQKEPVYVSVYGLTKAEDIDSLIVLAMYPLLKKKGVKMAWTAIGTGLRKFGIDLSKFDLSTFKGSLKNAVLCFDDLERRSASVPIEDMLGQINRYVEHENVKTVLIANEAEMGQGDAARRSTYAQVKEKLVGLTFTVETDPRTALDAALEDLHHVTQTTCIQHKSYIVKVADTHPAFNVRSLNLALHHYDTVVRNLHADKHFALVSFSLLRVILWGTIEIKKDDGNAARLAPLFEPDQNGRFSFYFNRENAEHLYLSKWLADAELSDENSGLSFGSVFDLIVTGILDQQQLRQEYDSTVRRLTTPEENEESLFQGQYLKLNDQTFHRLVQQKLDDLRNDRVTQGHVLVPLAQHLFYFSLQQLIDETDAQLLDLFTATVRRQANTGTFDFEHISPHGSLFVVNELDNAAYAELKALLLELAERDRALRRTEAVRQAFDRLLVDFDDGLRDLSDDQSILSQGTLFDVIGGERLVEIVDRLSPMQNALLRGWLRQRYGSINIMNFYVAEVPALQQFVNAIDARPRPRPRPSSLHAHSVNQIAAQVRSALTRPMPPPEQP